MQPRNMIVIGNCVHTEKLGQTMEGEPPLRRLGWVRRGLLKGTSCSCTGLPFGGQGTLCLREKGPGLALGPPALLHACQEGQPSFPCLLALDGAQCREKHLSCLCPPEVFHLQGPKFGLPRKTFTPELWPTRKDPRLSVLRTQSTSCPTAQRIRHPLWAKPQTESPGQVVSLPQHGSRSSSLCPRLTPSH